MNPVLMAKLKELYESDRPLRILDVGGSYAPCLQATHIVDIMPYDKLNLGGAYGYGKLNVPRENHYQMDLGESKPLPFPDKSFDFVVCRHTLEDISNPIYVCRELARVAKSGYIETPHRIYESTRGVERQAWVGHYHHRWFVEMDRARNHITFQFKPHNIHSHSRFHFWRPSWCKVRDEFKNDWLLWEGSFSASERVIIEYQDTKQNLIDYRNAHRTDRRLRWRWAKDGASET